MTRPKIKAADLPAGTNPLAQRLGAKLRLVRKGRELSFNRASEQLGISPGHYRWLEEGRITPGPAMASRLHAWLINGTTFEGAPPLSEAQFRVTREASKFRKVVAHIPYDEASALSRRAKAMGMSGSALVHLIIRQFLKNNAAFVTLSEAIKEINETRALVALEESPELRDILLADIPLMVKMGGDLTPWHQVENLEPPLVRVANIPVDSLKLSSVEPEYVEVGEDDDG